MSGEHFPWCPGKGMGSFLTPESGFVGGQGAFSGSLWCWAVPDASMGLMSLLSESPARLGLTSMPSTVRSSQVGHGLFLGVLGGAVGRAFSLHPGSGLLQGEDCAAACGRDGPCHHHEGHPQREGQFQGAPGLRRPRGLGPGVPMAADFKRILLFRCFR